MGERIVVVGAAMAGLRAAEQLRAAGFGGELVVVGEEPHLPYNRPPLSKEALAGRTDLGDLAFRQRKSVADVRWVLGTRVAAADLAARTLTLSDGDGLDYTGLVAATGVRASRLSLPGAHRSRHVVRTLDDARGLRSALEAGRSVVIVGAGFIGCEVAATARALGLEVTVVAPEEVPMQRPLGTMLGAELLRRHETHGVRFRMRRVPTAYGEHSVTLDDGSELPADVVVEAVGSRPNVEWLTGNGLDTSDGLLCDNALRVEGHPRVVAVGDIARFPNPLFDDVPRRVEHWNIPTDTARRAARTLLAGFAGSEPDGTPFTPMPSFWSDQYDLRLQSFGTPALTDGDIRILDGRLDDEVIVGYHRDGALVGVVGLGMTAATMAYRSRIGHPATRAA